MKYMNDKVTYIDAVLSLAPNTACKLESDGRSFEYFRNEDGITQPTTAEIDAEVIRLQAEYDSDYARKRQEEYPSLLELTVALYDTDDKSAVEAKRASVKAKFPKPA